MGVVISLLRKTVDYNAQHYYLAISLLKVTSIKIRVRFYKPEYNKQKSSALN
jgi:hypothetical protein